MVLYTEAELRAKILQIDQAIQTVAINGQSYTLNTGHGSQTVTRANMTELRRLRDWYMDEYRYHFGNEPNIISVTTNRGECSEYRSGS